MPVSIYSVVKVIHINRPENYATIRKLSYGELNYSYKKIIYEITTINEYLFFVLFILLVDLFLLSIYALYGLNFIGFLKVQNAYLLA